MNPPHERPDPDRLLARAKQAEARARRGKLRIFLGFAPGVGKTYRMLQAARDLVADQHLDLVVGVIETHRRRETNALVLGLELLPRRRVVHRGRTLEEFDLDAALARKPAIVLVDELAHTNAPESRHTKRWQDVNELLDAGIDVFSTLNVQHLESLNDVVSQITHIHVRETVPDSVLDDAAAVELVDIAPEELLARLKEGKIYLPAEAERARAHFFQRGNLLALRELALRRTAQHVDEDVREYREEHGVAAVWPAGERILVAVGPAPSSGRLIRAAARMAAGLRCPWVAAYVETGTPHAGATADRERLEAHLRVAESLGASAVRLSAARIAEALLGYAERHNVTRIVIGKPTHSRFRDRVSGSLLNEVVRGSGEIDVHVIGGDDAPAPPERDARSPSSSASTRHYLAAAASVAGALGLAALLESTLGLPDLEMLFLLAVMVSAAWFGRGPALAAAALGVASYDFFFVMPLHTFSVHDRKYFLTFAMMFGVGFVMSELAARLRRQEHDALSREERTGVLYTLTKELAATDEPERIAETAARHTDTAFAARGVVLVASTAGELRALAATPSETPLESKQWQVAKWTYDHDELAGVGTDTLPGAGVACVPLRAGASRLGVLVLFPSERTAFGADQRAFLEVFSRQIAVALERARLSEDARLAALRAKTEEMRSSLLSAVSHDLRTPLASITGAATLLRDDAKLTAATKGELVESIVDQAERLERLVANLLDMTRLASGTVVLKKDWVPLEEIVGSALTRLESRLEARAITVSIDADVPLLLVDPVLFEQLFVNLLENSDKYTPQATPLAIRAHRHGDQVAIDVIDQGPGFTPGSELKVFEKFFRGNEAGVTGAGLGLAICKAIAEAHGGTISAGHAERGGAIVRVLLPSSGTPPSLSEGAEVPP